MAKFTIEGLKEEYSSLGWSLLADKYENLSTMMECVCPEGHTNFITYDKWRKNHECAQCAAASLSSGKDNEIVPKSQKVKRTLVLDQATNTTGWAIFDDNKLVKYGIYNTKDAPTENRINSVKHWFVDMANGWRADRVVLEDIQLQNFGGGDLNTIGVTTFKTLAQLQGVLIDKCLELRLPFKVCHTGTWRTYNDIKGKSRADKKKSAQLLVKDIYNQNVSQDEADAICIGRYGLTLFKEVEFEEW